jgi:hypothetical protein
MNADKKRSGRGKDGKNGLRKKLARPITIRVGLGKKQSVWFVIGLR